MMQRITRVLKGFLGTGAALQQTSSRTVTSVRCSTSPVKEKLANHHRLNLLTAVSGFAKLEGPGRVGPGKFGDDAYFVTRTSFADVIGVADGVGGWREMGIDPGEFSTQLMRTCERLLCDGSYVGLCSQELLCMAYDELKRAKQHVLGSSTACVIMLNACNSSLSSSVKLASSTGTLRSANLGDSGFLVVRGGRVVFRSQEQCHYFNTPYQLSVPPPGSPHEVLSDSPRDSSTQSCEMVPGDLVLVATDGVFDNLEESKLLRVLETAQGTEELAVLEAAANNIANMARQYSRDPKFWSPFSQNARNHNLMAEGGKPDDITVVLAAIIGLDQG